MKLKLFLIISLVVLLGTACNKIDDPEKYGKGVTVFWANEEPWTASHYITVLNDSLLSLYAFKNEPFQKPYLYLQIELKEDDQLVNEYDYNIMANPNAVRFIEYYETQEVSDGYEQHGDWWAQSGCLKIAEVDNEEQRFSGDFYLQMFNAVERYDLQQSEVHVLPLRVVLNDVDLDNSANHKELLVNRN